MSGSVRIATSNAYYFLNSSNNDMCIYTSCNVTQQILFGVTSNTTAALTINSNNIYVAGNVNFGGALVNNGIPYTTTQWSNNSSNIFILNCNVGIKTSNPGFSLDVGGDVNFSGNLRQNGIPYFASQWSNAGSNLFILSNNVGIGKNNPTATLDVLGTINVTSNLSVGGAVSFQGMYIAKNTGGFVNVTSTLNQWGNNSSNVYLLNSNLGIGKSNPAATVDIAGTLSVSGISTFASNIMPLSNLVYDLGSSNMRFRTLYIASNTIDMSSIKLTYDNISGGLKITDSNNSNAPLVVKQLQIGSTNTSNNYVNLALDCNNNVQFTSYTVSNNIITNSNTVSVGGTNSNAAVTTSNSFIPSSNGGYDLGSSTNRWRNLYLSGNAISFGSNVVITQQNWTYIQNYVLPPVIQAPGATAINYVFSGVGQAHSAVIQNGQVYTFGLNANGQLGQGNTLSNYTTPTLISGISNAVQVVCGQYFTLILNNNSNVYAMGFNNFGQLGQNPASNVSLSNPTLISGLSNISYIAAGWDFSLFMSSSNVYGLGNNGRGQLGSGSVSSINYTLVSMQMPSLSNSGYLPQSIICGSMHSCLLLQNGAAYLCGDNSSNQLGVASNLAAYAATPGLLTTVQSIAKATCGSFHTVVATNYGNVYTFGANTYGQLGKSNTITYSNPQLVFSYSNIASSNTAYTSNIGGYYAIAAGLGHTILGTNFSSSNNPTYVWGNNSNGQLGLGSVTSYTYPTILAGYQALQVGCGQYHTIMLLSNNTFVGCGNNSNGQMGDAQLLLASQSTRIFPNLISLTSNVYPTKLQVSGGAAGTTSMIITSDGVLYGCGANNIGQLGLEYSGGSHYTMAPISIFDQRIVQVSCETAHTAAIDVYGNLYTWGYNGTGQLGYNSTCITDSYIPQNVNRISGGQITASTIITAVACGQNHTAALDSLGRVYCWGYNAQGQLNFNNSTTQYSYPINSYSFGSIANLSIIAIACGAAHTIALDSTGKVHAWGYNNQGQIGNNTTTNAPTSLLITGNYGSLTSTITVVAIACGTLSTFAIDSTGQIHAWGYNANGGLGNNSTTNSQIPINISSFGSIAGLNMVAIASGGNNNFTIALDSTGKVHTWGLNNIGQLGNNSSTQSLIPINISTYGSLNGMTIISIAAYGDHSMALDNTGQIHVWGNNNNGQLGNNTNVNSLVPIKLTMNVRNPIATPRLLSRGYGQHKIIRESINSMYMQTAGLNSYGQLGDNTTTYRYAGAFSLPGYTSFTSPIIAAANSLYHSAVILSTGAVYCWGRNSYYECGQTTNAIISDLGSFGLGSMSPYITGTLSNVVGGPYPSQPTQNAISFPGTSGNYISISSNTGTVFNWAFQDFTVEAWVNYTAYQSSNITQYPVMCGNMQPTNSTIDWSFGVDPSQHVTFYYNNSNSGPYSLQIPAVISLPGTTGSYLSYPGTSGLIFNWWQQDFTIEAWVNYSAIPALPSTTNCSTLCGNMQPTSNTLNWSFGVDNNMHVNFNYYNNAYVILASASTVTLNAWHHIAMTLNGTTIRIFLDGTLVGTSTLSGTPIVSTSIPFTIGSYFNYTTKAQMVDMRMIKGYAVYTAGFTPNTTVFNVASSGTTSLLLRGIMANMSDIGTLALGSINSYITGAVPIITGGPYASQSTVISLPGTTGNYVWYNGVASLIFNWWTQDFTIEAWVNYSAASVGTIPFLFGNMQPTTTADNWSFGLNSSNQLSFYYNNGAAVYVSSTTTVSLNAWHHVAMTLNGTTIRLFIDGALSQTATLSGTPQTVTNPFTIGAYNNTNISVQITDIRIIKSYAAYTVAFTPNTTYLGLTSSGTTMLLLHGGLTANVSDIGPLSLGPTSLYTTGNVGTILKDNLISSSNTVSLNTWHHIATSMSGSNITVYLDGTQVASSTKIGVPNATTSIPFTVASFSNVSINAQIADLRVTKGYAQYSSNFTVPSIPLTIAQNGATMLLLKSVPNNVGVPTQVSSLSGYNVVDVVCGSGITMFITATGSIISIGTNLTGMLGNGSSLSTSTNVSGPVIATGLTNIKTITCGENHASALDINGNMWVWGANTYGQFGLGNTSNLLVPTQVSSSLTGGTVLDVSVGQNHTLLVNSAYQVMTAGINLYGQLGYSNNVGTSNANTSFNIVNIPASTLGVINNVYPVNVACGQTHSVVLLANGTIRCFGNNNWGQLGLPSGPYSYIPIKPYKYRYVIYISASINTTYVECIVPREQNNSYNNTTTFTKIRSYGQYELASGTGMMGSCPVTSSGGCTMGYATKYGQLHMWGQNNSYQFGNGGTSQSAIPIQITNSYGALASSLINIVMVQMGDTMTIACDSNGQVYVWGTNNDGAFLGNGSATITTPVNISSYGSLVGAFIVGVSAGYDHMLACDSLGRIHAWGYNGNGQIGNGTTNNITNPIIINGISGSSITNSTYIVAVVCGGWYFSIALDSTGRVHTWGSNGNSALGNGNNNSTYLPAYTSPISGYLTSSYFIVAIAAGNYHSLALDSNGQIYAWGYNSQTQLGYGNNTTTYNYPVLINNSASNSSFYTLMSFFTSITASTGFSMGLDSQGRVHVWGYSPNYGNYVPPVNLGTLGSGPTVYISAVTNSIAIIDSYGTIWAGGNNTNGVNGNNNNYSGAYSTLYKISYSPVIGGASYGSLASGPGSGTMFWNFTGQHRCFVKEYSNSKLKDIEGLIVCANNSTYMTTTSAHGDAFFLTGKNAITTNDSLPLLSLCKKAKDKTVFGVVSLTTNYDIVPSPSEFELIRQIEQGDHRAEVNSVGEGAVWICDINGSVEAGDYITTSDVPGYGQKQDEPYICNYTLGKMTMDCDFNPRSIPIVELCKDDFGNNALDETGMPKFKPVLDKVTGLETMSLEYELRYLSANGTIISFDQYSNSTEIVYKAAFVGVTYHCG